jgi:hypothetical protein
MVEVTLRKVVAYLTGIGLGLFGLIWVLAALLGQGGLVGGLLLVIVGAFTLPIVRSTLNQATGITFSTALVVVIVVVGAVVGLGLIGANTNDGGGDSGTASTPTSQSDGASASTATATATATPDRSLNHSLGESFRVGSGDQTVEYTITDVRTASQVGSDAVGAEADGEFVIVRMELENVGSESFDVSSDPFTLVDDQGRSYDVDREAQVYPDNAIVFEQLDPGLSKEGVVVFDVPPDQTGRELKIEPVGVFSTADPHYVALE